MVAKGAGRYVSQKIKDAGINGNLADSVGEVVSSFVDQTFARALDQYQRPSLHPRLETFQREAGTVRKGLR